MATIDDKRGAAQQHSPTDARSLVERISLEATLPLAVAVYAICAAVFAFLSRSRLIDGAVVTIAVTATVAAVSFFSIFITFWRRQVQSARTSEDGIRIRDWFFSAGVIALGYSVAVGVASYVGMSAVSAAFRGLNYGVFVGALWPAITAAVSCYWAVSVGALAKMTNLMRLVALYLSVGVIIAGIANPNPGWWRISISYLGMNQLPSAQVFNISTMIAAALFLASAIFTFPAFGRTYRLGLISRRALTFIKVVFIWAPCGLFLVGACPYGSSELNTFLHNFGAYTMFFVMGLMMVLSGILMPFLSKPFLRVNYTLFASLLVMALFWLIPPHRLTLGVFEALGIAVIAIWLMLILTALENELATHDGSFKRYLSEKRRRRT